MQLFSACRPIPRGCLYARTSRFDDIMLYVALTALFVGLLAL